MGCTRTCRTWRLVRQAGASYPYPLSLSPALSELVLTSRVRAPPRSSSLPPPIQPRSAEDTYRHGSLSDFSDYSSDDDYSSDASHGPSQHSAAGSYAAQVREERAKGPLAAQEAEEDPFADPFADSNAGDYEVLTPGITDKRMEWKEV